MKTLFRSQRQRQPWRLVLGYGTERRRWRKVAARLAVASLFLAPLSCFLSEHRKAAHTFEVVTARIEALKNATAAVAARTGQNASRRPIGIAPADATALTRQFHEAAFGFAESPTFQMPDVVGNRELMRGANLATDRIAKEAAERSKRSGIALTTQPRGNGMMAFAPVHVGGAIAGWIVTAFRVENLMRTAEPRPEIDFQIFDRGPTLLRLDTEHQSGKAPTANVGLTFKRELPAFDRTWIVYQTRNRPVAVALLAPAGLFWLLCSATSGIAWLAGIRRRRSFELGATVLDALVDVLLVVDPVGTIVYTSPSVTKALGYDAVELPRRPLVELFHAEDQGAVEEALEASRQTDEAQPIERLRVQAKDRSWRTVSGMSRRLIIGESIVDFLVTLHDVTNLLGLERQLEAADRAESLGRVAANATHEFRNILMALDTNLSLLERTAPDERTASVAEMLRRYVRRGSGIAEEILRFAAPGELHVSSIDARRWLDQMERELRPLLGTKADLTVQVDEPLVFQGDEDRLSQVLTNLILNSRDAIREHGHVSCMASRCEGGNFAFGIVPTGHFAHLEVSDDGEGMSATTAHRIFEPLFTTKPKGTGLGLAISRQIVSAHHGLLFAESATGRGTSMHIFLPIGRTITPAA